MSGEEQLCEKIEAILRATESVPEITPNFSWDTDLFDYGYVDSFGIVELIAAIDAQCGVDLSNEDFYRDLRTVRAIGARLAQRKAA